MRAGYRAKGQTVRELSGRKQGNVDSRHLGREWLRMAVEGKLKAERKRSGRRRYQSNWGEK